VAVFHVVNGGLTRDEVQISVSISGIFFDNGKTPEDFSMVTYDVNMLFFSFSHLA
jgi:hypothetical protein